MKMPTEINGKPVKVRAIIDADVCVYNSAFCGQTKDENGELEIKDFEVCMRSADEKVAEICEAIGATELSPKLIFSGDKKFEKLVNRKRANDDLDPITIEPNYRIALATLHEYKGNRKKTERPFHYYNSRAYLHNKFDSIVTSGIEADDYLCYLLEIQEKAGGYFDRGEYIEIIVCCSIDKDLRTQRGWHYGFGNSNVKEVPLHYVDKFGKLWLNEKGEVKGNGTTFLAHQMLIGDSIDNIMGCGEKVNLVYKSGAKAGQEYQRRQGVGAKASYQILQYIDNEDDLFKAVALEYKEKFGEGWKAVMLENARLVYMVNTKLKNGKWKMWQLPKNVQEMD